MWLHHKQLKPSLFASCEVDRRERATPLRLYKNLEGAGGAVRISKTQLGVAGTAIPANKLAERGEPKRKLALKPRWSKRGFPQQPQVSESNG